MLRAKIGLAGLVLAAVVPVPATAQMTRPFEVLEGARRDRIESDKRMARDAAEQRRKDKERAATNARQDAATRKAATQPPLTSAPARPAGSSARP